MFFLHLKICRIKLDFLDFNGNAISMIHSMSWLTHFNKPIISTHAESDTLYELEFNNWVRCTSNAHILSMIFLIRSLHHSINIFVSFSDHTLRSIMMMKAVGVEFFLFQLKLWSKICIFAMEVSESSKKKINSSKNLLTMCLRLQLQQSI